MEWIDKLIESMQTAIDSASNLPAPKLNPKLIACTAAKRPGFSTLRAVGRALDDCKKRGINFGKNADGSESLLPVLVHSIIEGGFGEWLENGVIDMSVDANSIISTGPGGASINSGFLSNGSGQGIPR